MRKVFEFILSAALAVPACAQAPAIDDLAGSSPETRIQAPPPVPRAVEQPGGGATAGYAFLLKPEAEHAPDAELFDVFSYESEGKNSRPAIPKKIPYLEIARKESAAQSVDIHLILAVIQKESSFDSKAYNKSGAVGLMQVLPSTAKDLGLKNAASLWKPEVNIKYGTKYLKQLWCEFSPAQASISTCKPGNQGFANTLAAYNAGPGNVRKYQGVPPFKETRNYVKLVGEYIAAFEQLLADF